MKNKRVPVEISVASAKTYTGSPYNIIVVRTNDSKLFFNRVSEDGVIVDRNGSTRWQELPELPQPEVESIENLIQEESIKIKEAHNICMSIDCYNIKHDTQDYCKAHLDICLTASCNNKPSYIHP